MVLQLKHAMRPSHTADELSRQNFVAGLRSFVLNDLAADMRHAYDERVKPDFEHRAKRAPANGPEVHKAMRGDPMFSIYSALRVKAQHMVWDSVASTVDREHDRIHDIAANALGGGSVEIDPAFAVPRNVTAIDVHLMPGSYTGTKGPEDMTSGAVYDQALTVFSFGLMGDNLDDIGTSISRFVAGRFPDFKPKRILDTGCLVGHNTQPWAKTYPDADVYGIDVAAPGLLYGHARSKLQDVHNIHYKQMNATTLDFEDNSFDLVFSSMFFHELSLADTRKALKEAHRVLRPGGLMLHMELPPNPQMSAYESFYLDWDCYYNAEPFYKAFRDQDPRVLCADAGFATEDYVQFVVPSLGFYGEAAIDEAIEATSASVDSDKTGRLADGVRWFSFGSWKR